MLVSRSMSSLVTKLLHICSSLARTRSKLDESKVIIRRKSRFLGIGSCIIDVRVKEK